MTWIIEATASLFGSNRSKRCLVVVECSPFCNPRFPGERPRRPEPSKPKKDWRQKRVLV